VSWKAEESSAGAGNVADIAVVNVDLVDGNVGDGWNVCDGIDGSASRALGVSLSITEFSDSAAEYALEVLAQCDSPS
jgi:hypothetical protein